MILASYSSSVKFNFLLYTLRVVMFTFWDYTRKIIAKFKQSINDSSSSVPLQFSFLYKHKNKLL